MQKLACDTQKKTKSKHPSSLAQRLFDGSEEDDDDLFLAPSLVTSTTKSKQAGEYRGTLFDEVDLGMCSHTPS